MTKLNFSCLIGSELGYLKNFNAFDWKIENEISLKIGQISLIRKHNNEYYVGAANKLYHMGSISEESKSLFYQPQTNRGNIIGFDFIEESVVVGFNDGVHVVKDKEIVAEIGSGKYEAFQVLRNGDVAVGGPNKELHVYNVSSADKPLFVSKAEPNKGLSLPGKVWMTAIAQDTEADNIVYCGTKYATVQLYDIRARQRKAQLTANFEANRSVVTLTALAPHQLVAGSSGGSLGVVDFRGVYKQKPGASEHVANYAKFKGSSASTLTHSEIVRDVLCGHETGQRRDLLLSTSLDGHLTVHDLNSRQLVDKIFLGKKPLCLLVDSVNAHQRDELWHDLEGVEQAMDKKRAAKDSSVVHSAHKKLKVK